MGVDPRAQGSAKDVCPICAAKINSDYRPPSQSAREISPFSPVLPSLISGGLIWQKGYIVGHPVCRRRRSSASTAYSVDSSLSRALFDPSATPKNGERHRRYLTENAKSVPPNGRRNIRTIRTQVTVKWTLCQPRSSPSLLTANIQFKFCPRDTRETGGVCVLPLYFRVLVPAHFGAKLDANYIHIYLSDDVAV